MLEVVTLEDAAQLVTSRFATLAGTAIAQTDGFGSFATETPETERLVAQANMQFISDNEPTIASAKHAKTERATLDNGAGRRIANDVIAEEGVPPFDRSMVDGFAVVAADTFGCSDSLPALLNLVGEIEMGAQPTCVCTPGTCVRIPTGGQTPEGADAVVMLEYCEEYGDGTVGIARPAAPGDSIVFAHDDVKPGQTLIEAGTRLAPHHIGTLASLGMTEFDVLAEQVGAGLTGTEQAGAKQTGAEQAGDWQTDADETPSTSHASASPQFRVAVISTGDEIIDASKTPIASQMRDVNAPLLAAAVEACGAHVQRFPIVPDDYDALHATVTSALETCDMVLVSGGSSAGQKDNTARVLTSLGEMLFHGVAVKPGKPTMCADIDGIPAFGLPGHPVAAYFMFLELVRPLLIGTNSARANAAAPMTAKLAEGIPSNHGRAEFVAVQLERRDDVLYAVPVRGKSGLISQLSMADGYVVVGRNQEGLAAGVPIEVQLFA